MRGSGSDGESSASGGESRPGTLRERVADGFRGRLDVDLKEYAGSRGLEHLGGRSVPGILAAFPMHPELQFNVLAGELPGGETGALFHEVRMLDEDRAGTYYGVRAKSERLELRHLFEISGGPDAYFKAPFTTVAIRLPEAQGVLVGLQAARKGDGGVSVTDTKVGLTIGRKGGSTSAGPGYWGRKPRSLDDLGCKGWVANGRGRGDADAFEEVVAGPLRELLAAEQPAELRIEYRFGALIVSQQHFAKSGAELDALAQKASGLAAGMRRLCERYARPVSLADSLAEPAWAEIHRTKPKDWIGGGAGQNLGSVGKAADALGMTAESEWEFGRGSSDLGIPGEPFGVMRGELPGTGVEGRLVGALEHRVVEPDARRLRLKSEYELVYGCDAALLPAATGAAETGVLGEPWGEWGGYSVRRGILTAWRPRRGSALDAGELKALAEDAASLGRECGLL